MPLKTRAVGYLVIAARAHEVAIAGHCSLLRHGSRGIFLSIFLPLKQIKDIVKDWGVKAVLATGSFHLGSLTLRNKWLEGVEGLLIFSGFTACAIFIFYFYFYCLFKPRFFQATEFAGASDWSPSLTWVSNTCGANKDDEALRC